MGPRKTEFKKTAKQPSDAQKPRFQIAKLEERIAPGKGGVPDGGNGHGNGTPCHNRC